MTASAIYADFVGRLRADGVTPRYLVHVTGHGWRKLMRLDRELGYVIDAPGDLPPLFRFLMDAGPVETAEAFATFNMGVGFAAYVRPADAAATVAAAEACGHRAWLAGRVTDGPKRVEVPTLGLRYDAATLSVR